MAQIAEEWLRREFRIISRAGMPLGEDLFIEKLERLLDRNLKPQKPGPRNKDK